MRNLIVFLVFFSPFVFGDTTRIEAQIDRSVYSETYLNISEIFNLNYRYRNHRVIGIEISASLRERTEVRLLSRETDYSRNVRLSSGKTSFFLDKNFDISSSTSDLELKVRGRCYIDSIGLILEEETTRPPQYGRPYLIEKDVKLRFSGNKNVDVIDQLDIDHDKRLAVISLEVTGKSRTSVGTAQLYINDQAIGPQKTLGIFESTLRFPINEYIQDNELYQDIHSINLQVNGIKVVLKSLGLKVQEIRRLNSI